MIVDSIRFGSRIVEKGYRNGVLIWPTGEFNDLGSLLELMSVSVSGLKTNRITEVATARGSHSDTDAVLEYITILGLTGAASSSSELVGNGVLIPAVVLKGASESESFGKFNGSLFRAVNGSAREDNISTAIVSGTVYRRVYAASTGDLETKSRTSMSVYIREYVSATDDTVSRSVVQPIVIPLSKILLIDGFHSDSKSSIMAAVKTAPLFEVRCGADSNSGSDSAIDQFPTTALPGQGDSHSSSESYPMIKPIPKMAVRETNSATYTARGGLYYPPILKEGALFIRMAYDATLTDGILEVI